MTDDPIPTPRLILRSIEPQLSVADVKRSCDFYTDKLGFAVAFLYGEPPHYAQLFRDQARFNLRLIDKLVFSGDLRQREALLSASITLATDSEIKQLFLDHRAAGVSFHRPLKPEP